MSLLAPEIDRQFPIAAREPAERTLEHVKSALARKLPRIAYCKRHDRILSIAGGGPSLADTFEGMEGLVASANGSLGFLCARNRPPWACGVMDPGEHMADVVEDREGVVYFLASTCHPSLFDHLANRTVVLWHPSGEPLIDAYLASVGVDTVPGGSTIGLRWIELGCLLGFRTFHLHGFDSSFRGETHAYPDRISDKRDRQFVDGYETSRDFIEQVRFALKVAPQWRAAGLNIKVFGEGLFPMYWRMQEVE